MGEGLWTRLDCEAVARVCGRSSLWALRGSARVVPAGGFAVDQVRAVSRLGQRGARPRSGSQPRFAAGSLPVYAGEAFTKFSTESN